MGVAVSDADGDGDEDLFVSHLTEETNTFYLNEGTGVFRDGTLRLGLAAASLAYTGFGCEWFDYDHDGWLDLFVVNGAVSDIESLRDKPHPFQQRNQLFRGVGDGGFDEVRGEAGSVLELVDVSRGAAFGDVDNDGDIDVVVSNNNGPGPAAPQRGRRCGPLTEGSTRGGREQPRRHRCSRRTAPRRSRSRVASRAPRRQLPERERCASSLRIGRHG